MMDKTFEERMEYLQGLFGPQGTHAAPHIVIVQQVKAENKEHVLERLKEVESLGGEGVMLRKPES
jgi:DNA ligase-1